MLSTPHLHAHTHTHTHLFHPRLLRTQVEVVLCERLNSAWGKLTGDVKESSKRLGKKANEYDAARLRHLGHK